jgi:hypothetical protein
MSKYDLTKNPKCSNRAKMEQSQKSQKQPKKRQSRSTAKKKSKGTGKENKLNEILVGLFLILIIALIVAFSSISVEGLLLVLVKFILLIFFYVLSVFFFKRILKIRRSPKISKKQVSQSSRKSKHKKEQKTTVTSVEEAVEPEGQKREKLQEIEKGQEIKQTEKLSSEEKTPEKEVEQKTTEEQVKKVFEEKQEKQSTEHPETQQIKTFSGTQKAPTKSSLESLLLEFPSRYSSSSEKERKIYNCDAPVELLSKYFEAENYVSDMKKEIENIKLSDEEDKFLREKLKLIQRRLNQVSATKKAVEEKKKSIVEECLNELKSKENLKNYERQYLSYIVQLSIDAARHVVDEKKIGSAFAYGYLLILLMKDFKELEKILTPLFYVNCIYTVPLFCLPSKEKMTPEEYEVNVLKRNRVLVSDVADTKEYGLEEEDDYLSRMSGIISLFFSINIFPQGRKKEESNLNNLWSWFQNFINQEPNKYAIKLLDRFFSYVGLFLFFWPEEGKYFNNAEEQRKFRKYLEKLKKTIRDDDENSKIYFRALEQTFSRLVELHNKRSPEDLLSEYPDILTEKPPKDSIIMKFFEKRPGKKYTIRKVSK